MKEPETAKEARAEHADFMERFGSTLTDALKMKARMKERGLTSAHVKCPQCPGRLHMRLVGPKKHMRFWCDGTCKRSMIE